ncbi:MAG: glycosyltransferase [Candidatus Sericytochromatia bacterium]|nr:glycosyltransferase [Candidatus Sericytochromatia bacterium]
MPKLSILVPTYNRCDYLRICLDSLLTTTVSCEILVGDNASSDGTADLMAGYDDPRFRYIRHATNTGPWGNYNALLAAATGDYVCLFGDDDMALPGCFEPKVAILEAEADVTAVFSNLSVMDDVGTLRSGSVHGAPEVSYLRGRDDFAHLLINCCLSWQSLVFRRSVSQQIGPFVETSGLFALDWDFLITLSAGRTFAYINEPLVAVRMHHDSISNGYTWGNGLLVTDTLAIWHKWLLESDLYPVIGETTWAQMRKVLNGAVANAFGANSPILPQYVEMFHAMKAAYKQRMERRFGLERRRLCPDGPELDAHGVPIFRQGLPPLLMSDHKPILFFHHPDWRENRWRDVVRSFVQAYQGQASVELLLWHDPAQGVPFEAAIRDLQTAFLSATSDPAQAPDVTLLPDPLDLPGLASLYAAAHVIVAAGDPVMLSRGSRCSPTVMAQITPEAWRRVGNQLGLS